MDSLVEHIELEYADASSTDHDDPVWSTMTSSAQRGNVSVVTTTTTATRSSSSSSNKPAYSTGGDGRRRATPGDTHLHNGRHYNDNNNAVNLDSTKQAEATGDSVSVTLQSFLEFSDPDLQEKTLQFLDDPETYFSHLEQEDNIKVGVSCGLFIFIVAVTLVMMFTLNPPM